MAAVDVKNDANLSTSLVSYWELEESSGTRVDSHGSNDLTDNNTVLSASGVRGDAADLESSNSEYLSNLSQTGMAPGTGNFSISLWAKVESDGTVGSGNGGPFSLAATSADRIWLDARTSTITGQFYDGANGANCSYSGSFTGNWHHIVFLRDGGNAKLYVDSVLRSTNSATFGTPANANLDLVPQVKIGSSSQGTARYYDGMVDEVGYWTKALSTTEISDLYNSGAGIPYEATGGSTFTPKVTMF